MIAHVQHRGRAFVGERQRHHVTMYVLLSILPPSHARAVPRADLSVLEDARRRHVGRRAKHDFHLGGEGFPGGSSSGGCCTSVACGGGPEWFCHASCRRRVAVGRGEVEARLAAGSSTDGWRSILARRVVTGWGLTGQEISHV